MKTMKKTLLVVLAFLVVLALVSGISFARAPVPDSSGDLIIQLFGPGELRGRLRETSPDDFTKELIAATVERSIEDPAEDLIEDPVEDLIEGPAEDLIEDPTEDPIEIPVEDPAEEPVQEPD